MIRQFCRIFVSVHTFQSIIKGEIDPLKELLETE